jgi:hypothetical protein
VNRRRPPIKINSLSYAKLIKHLLAVPATVHELAEETGLHHLTVALHMRALHAERLVHIGGWEQDSMGRDASPVWTWGAGRDKPRARKTSTERHRLYLERRKQAALLQRMAGQLKEAA